MSNSVYKGIFDSNKSYPALSIVQDSNSQNAILYISTKTVPIGSSLFDPTYWVKYNKICGLTEGEVEEMITSYCGDLDDLTTSDKSSIVNAINELDAEHEALSETVSDIDTLLGHEPLTTEATNVTGAINELVTGVDGLGDRVDALEERPEPVQSDWDEEDTTDLAFIKNKPTIPTETPIATTEIAGKVKPDGQTITITEDGVISAVGGGSGEWTLAQSRGGSTVGNDSKLVPTNAKEIMVCLYSTSTNQYLTGIWHLVEPMINQLLSNVNGDPYPLRKSYYVRSDLYYVLSCGFRATYPTVAGYNEIYLQTCDRNGSSISSSYILKVWYKV